MNQLDGLINLDPVALGLVVVRTLVVYVALLIGFRLLGKRGLSQMGPFDLTVLLIVSNAVQNAMVGSDTSLNAGLLAAATLLAADRILDRIALKRRSVIGSPTLLVQDGHILDQRLHQEGVAVDDVLQALREHGVADLSKVKLAVLEVDGTISVIPQDAPTSRTRRRVRARKFMPN